MFHATAIAATGAGINSDEVTAKLAPILEQLSAAIGTSTILSTSTTVNTHLASLCPILLAAGGSVGWFSLMRF